MAITGTATLRGVPENPMSRASKGSVPQGDTSDLQTVFRSTNFQKFLCIFRCSYADHPGFLHLEHHPISLRLVLPWKKSISYTFSTRGRTRTECVALERWRRRHGTACADSFRCSVDFSAVGFCWWSHHTVHTGRRSIPRCSVSTGVYSEGGLFWWRWRCQAPTMNEGRWLGIIMDLVRSHARPFVSTGVIFTGISMGNIRVRFMECLLVERCENAREKIWAGKIEWIQPFLFDLDARCVTGYNESCKFGVLFEQANGGSRKIVLFR